MYPKPTVSNLCAELKYDLRRVKPRENLREEKSARPKLFGKFRPGCGAFDLDGKSARHTGVAEAVGERASPFKDFERTRYPALAEQDPGFAKYAGVARTFFGRIHDHQTTHGER